MNVTRFAVEYEYATIALLIVLMALYVFRRKIRTINNSLVFAMMVMNLMSTIMHIVTTSTITHASDYSLMFNYAANVLYLISYNLVAVVYLIYVCNVIRSSKIRKSDRMASTLAFLVVIIPLLTTPFTKLIIYFDEDMNYYHGPLFALLPIVAFSILIYSFVLFFKNRDKIKAKQGIFIYSFIVVELSATLIQLIRSDLIIGNYATTLALLLAYIAVENPFDYVNLVTDCANTTAFYTVVDSYITRQKRFAVIVFKPEGMESLTDVIGVKAVSLTKSELAQQLKDYIENKDLFYLGKWQFAIIVKESKREKSVREYVELIKSFFSEPITFRGIQNTIIPYIATLHYPDFITSAEDAKSAIEYTMEHHPEMKDGATVVSENAIIAKRRELQVLSSIRKFIAQDAFEMYYQPIYSTREKSFISAEALVRMKDSNLGFVSPEEFIPMAEENGLITDIGIQTFKKVCKFLTSEDAQGLGIRYIEVNLSTVQCVQENLADSLVDVMNDFNVSPKSINFEITETAGLANYDTLITNMNKLIEAGAEFSMDDYGTGFSTANYLISLPVELVKIDKSILWPAMKDEKAFVILKKTVEMLKELGKQIVVEGVETKEMVDVLTEIGVDFLQGYYFSRPIPATEYVQFLKKSIEKKEMIDEVMEVGKTIA